MLEVFQILIKLDLKHDMFLLVGVPQYHRDQVSKKWSLLPQIIQKYW